MDDLIRKDLKQTFEIVFDEAIPVSGGYLNEKWKVHTSKEKLLIKKFSHKRYNAEKLKAVEEALQRQVLIAKTGVPCPIIRMHEGKIVQILNDETAYMVMEYKRGQLRDYESVSVPQMHNLGKVCGQMHKAFAQLPVSGMTFDTVNTDSLWENYFTTFKEAVSSGNTEYIRAVSLQKPILEKLTDDFFINLPKGITHKDFASDNVLFDGDEVSAIIDFDTNRYGYVWQDVGRALLSFAFHNNQIGKDKIIAFVNGYSQYLPMDFESAIYALRLSWCLEVVWWIQRYCFEEDRKKVSRFRDELCWLTQHWFDLGLL